MAMFTLCWPRRRPFGDWSRETGGPIACVADAVDCIGQASPYNHAGVYAGVYAGVLGYGG